MKDALEAIRKLEFVGVNLTVPHKVAGCALMDEIDAEAKPIGAINTVAIREGRLVGFNTDASGFMRALRSEFSVDLRDLRVLLLGAGGVARAIAVQCARAQCERLVSWRAIRPKRTNWSTLVGKRFAGLLVAGPRRRGWKLFRGRKVPCAVRSSTPI